MLSILFILLLLVSPVYADDFDMTGDTLDSHYFDTIGLSRGSLPEYDEGANGLMYWLEDLDPSVDTQIALRDYAVSNLTRPSQRRSRYAGKLDYVQGPPGTTVDIIYYYFNNSNHMINITEIAIPFSHNQPAKGDFMNIVDVNYSQPDFKDFFVLVNGDQRLRQAKMKVYGGPGDLPHASSGAVVMDTVTIRNPISYSELLISKEGDIYTISVRIDNVSLEKLNNIRFEHGDYIETFDLEFESSRLLEYTLSDIDSNPYFTIGYAGVKTECIIKGANFDEWWDVNASTVLSKRQGFGWSAGAYLNPPYDMFCIKRDPFVMNGPDLNYENIQENDSIDSSDVGIVSTEEEESVQDLSEEVLGVKDTVDILPNTAKNMF